jgi:hypothetical protein
MSWVGLEIARAIVEGILWNVYKHYCITRRMDPPSSRPVILLCTDKCRKILKTTMSTILRFMGRQLSCTSIDPGRQVIRPPFESLSLYTETTAMLADRVCLVPYHGHSFPLIIIIIMIIIISKGDTTNKGNWNHIKSVQTLFQQRTWKARNQRTTENIHTGQCAHIAESTNVKVQNIFNM